METAHARKRIALAVVLLFVSVSCTSESNPTEQVGRADSPEEQSVKRVVAAIRGSPWTLNSRMDGAAAESTPGVETVEELLHAGLVAAGLQGRLLPQLAEAVPSIDNRLWRVFPDGTMETTWRIRPGAMWHDGAPFTSADLIFTQRVSQEPRLPMFADPASRFIDEVLAPDPGTVVVRWKSLYAEADALFSRMPLHVLPLPSHILAHDLEHQPENVGKLDYWLEMFVGLGPFSIHEIHPGSSMLLVANGNYVLGRPTVDEIEVRFLPNVSDLVAGVLAGDIDLSLGRGLSLIQALEIRERWRDGQVVFSYANWQAIYPQYVDPTPGEIADVRFRRGLLAMTDRQALVDELMAGLVPIAHVYLSPQDAAYGEVASSIVRYGFDPTRAEQELRAAGLTRGPDGAYRDFRGALLPRLEIQTTAQTALQPRVAAAVADQWRRGGLEVDPVLISGQRVLDREYRATRPAFELARQPNETGAFLRLHSSQAPLAENGYTGVNRARYRNSELDALIERYSVTIPVPDRMDALRLIVRHITDQAVWLGLFYEIEPGLVSSRVRNVGGRGSIATQAWNASQWDVD